MGVLNKVGQRLPFTRKGTHNKDLLRSLLIMAWMVEARDPYTGGHLWRVSRMCNLLAQKLEWSAADIARVTLGGFLHDLGKIGVSDQILNKKDPLTEKEYEVIKTHPGVGWNTLSDHPLSWLVENSIRFHHERPDGNGYPLGLVGDQIPKDARVVAICDAFDAMTSIRPYRQGMSIAKALNIIEENLGSQFDQDFGQHFISLGRSGLFHHIVSHSDEGIPLQYCIMCGPTVVVQRDQKPGENVYCPNCTGEYVIRIVNGKTTIELTEMRSGKPKDMELRPDNNLISRLLTDATKALPAW